MHTYLWTTLYIIHHFNQINIDRYLNPPLKDLFNGPRCLLLFNQDLSDHSINVVFLRDPLIRLSSAYRSKMLIKDWNNES